MSSLPDGTTVILLKESASQHHQTPKTPTLAPSSDRDSNDGSNTHNSGSNDHSDDFNPPQPNVVIPKFDDVTSSFFPFIRIDDTRLWTRYERIKTLIVAVFIAPFRLLIWTICMVFTWIFALIAICGLSTNTLDDLRQPLARWRQSLLWLMRATIRVATCLALGVYRCPMTRLTYRDIQQWYRLPPAYAAKYGDNCEPPCYCIVANHLGYIDILVLLYKFNAAFVAKAAIRTVPFIGTICAAIQSLWVTDNVPLTKLLIERLGFTHSSHEYPNPKCSGCMLCTTNLIVFPEGTTTNGKAMLRFRTGVFAAGCALRPVIVRLPYQHFNTTWESYPFMAHFFRVMTQWVNYCEITVLPPYVPNERELADPALYATNVQNLMANVSDSPIYYLNRNQKVAAYHPYVMRNIGLNEVLQIGKENHENDALFQILGVTESTHLVRHRRLSIASSREQTPAAAGDNDNNPTIATDASSSISTDDNNTNVNK